MQLHSYPKIYNLNHYEVEGILDKYVQVEEKVDGSQFSFGIREKDGLLLCRSKSASISIGGPPAAFIEAVDTVLTLLERDVIKPGWIYRCEYLQKPKHNVLRYDQIPRGHLVLFDVEMSDGKFIDSEARYEIAAELGIDVVPILARGKLHKEELDALLKTESFLGGTQIEGVVIKTYADQPMVAKYVSPQFREKASPDWKVNVRRNDTVQRLIEQLTTEARWQKAIQHLQEADQLSNSPSDIGPIIKEVLRDVQEEEGERIREVLFKHTWPIIAKGITKGLPNWYKARIFGEQNAAK